MLFFLQLVEIKVCVNQWN